ncbi:MAG TPA: SDR family NAD(P)-dependent oxidoreductase [Thermomicrobiales bacterium]|nr:SDR family NAD(P)-dependent oxidoreductase [Thermomicrobiales bacterium]
MDRFSGKTAVVTGGANGIGLGVARRLASEGAVVWIADVDPEVTAIAASFGGAGVRCDVADAAAVDALVADVLARRGRLDVLVANAGVGGGARVAELSDDLFRRLLTTNLDGVFHACRAARAMEPQRAGAIVTVSSVFGRDAPAGSAAYGAAKAGVIALTQALARELGPSGIRVNAVCPGHIMTEHYVAAVGRRAAATGRSAEAVFADELAAVPLGRFGGPDDVAAVVAFLASADAGYLTGQAINIDGGLQMR